MPIPLFLLDRIKTSAMSGEKVADTFAKLAQVADQRDIDGCAIKLEYVKDSDTLLPGDLVPTITLSLARHARVIDAENIEVRPMSDPDAYEAPNPACTPPFMAAEAAVDLEE